MIKNKFAFALFCLFSLVSVGFLGYFIFSLCRIVYLTDGIWGVLGGVFVSFGVILFFIALVKFLQWIVDNAFEDVVEEKEITYLVGFAEIELLSIQRDARGLFLHDGGEGYVQALKKNDANPVGQIAIFDNVEEAEKWLKS